MKVIFAFTLFSSLTAGSLVAQYENVIPVDKVLSYVATTESSGAGTSTLTITAQIEWGLLYSNGTYVRQHVGTRADFWIYESPGSPFDSDQYYGPVAFYEWSKNRMTVSETPQTVAIAFPWLVVTDVFTRYPGVWNTHNRTQIAYRGTAGGGGPSLRRTAATWRIINRQTVRVKVPSIVGNIPDNSWFVYKFIFGTNRSRVSSGRGTVFTITWHGTPNQTSILHGYTANRFLKRQIPKRKVYSAVVLSQRGTGKKFDVRMARQIGR